jgi:polyene macrolide polyketide synthase
METGEMLEIPDDASSWRVDSERRGTVESLAVVDGSQAEETLKPGQVRVEVRAAGLNFRDVLIALDMYPGAATIGGEAAGVVAEVGEEVPGLAVGDRVMGLMDGAIGNFAVTDSRLLAPVPAGWSFVEAASVPIAFATAYYGLVDLAGLKRGERLLVHAATGGVGIAAVQLARHLGAEVYGTASPGKWAALRALGFADTHMASSRTLAFSDELLQATDGHGMNVILNSLSGDFVEGSLALLPNGGRFLEMGKTDVRDPVRIASEYEGVDYRAFDLMDAGAERLREIFTELVALFESGVLAPAPIRTWSVRRARQAFRHMSQGRHVGKNVLCLPRAIDTEGTVLITGATGGLGALVARHMVVEHGVRNLLLVSRQGSQADGASHLVEELATLGAQAQALSCDVADGEQVRGLLEGIPREHPLDAVIHAAGVIDDGVIGSLTPERIDRVLAPKVAGAWNLHKLTREMDLSAFVLFSSIAGTLGSSGQGNYAAANAYLDALAAHRCALGLTGTSIAWGLWKRTSEMTGHLGELDRNRMSRAGVLELSDEQGLQLLDRALTLGEAFAVSARLDPRALRAQARSGELDGLLRGVVRVRTGKSLVSSSRDSFARRLSEVAQHRRGQVVLELIRSQAARVLGHDSGEAIEPHRPFKELGFDSLAGVELRNRLAAEIGMALPATLVFDYPTPLALTQRLLDALTGDGADARPQLPRASVNIDEPIAIVGMSCRYPGGVGTPEELWELVHCADDAIGPFPADRGWDLESLYDPDPDRIGTSYGREGGFVDGVDEFDAAFFGIGPREALAMDPQQRLLLELSWEALENARIDPSSLKGTQAGVFAGAGSSNYGLGSQASENTEGYELTGTATSVISGRVAYALGLEGPAVTVDTACSSSLVAIHWACQALRSGECSLALAGGVTVLSTPAVFVEFSRQRGLAPDGRCKPFADAANGVGWSEGAGMLLLERLSDARRNAHRILATVRGSAVNQDGASNGLTAPNGPSQQRVILQALANAGLSSNEVDAVEGHGTGTALGDPIEAQALLATYGRDRPEDHPLWLGSVKSNIGHTQAAAGVAGVIKTVMAMRRGVLPRTLHADTPSSQVNWSQGAVLLLRERIPWRSGGDLRRAGVSSFGISGTNAHLILEESPAPARADSAVVAESANPEIVPWVLSARDERGLRAQVERLKVHLGANPDLCVKDIGLSLSSTRTAFAHRLVALGGDRATLLDELDRFGDGSIASQALHGVVGEAGALAVLFTGQGAQRVGMGKELYEAFPIFAGALDEACGYLDGLLGCSLQEVMFGGEPPRSEESESEADYSSERCRLDETAFTQAALFALEAALFRLVQSFGLRPDFVMGHSVGEIVGAHVAGVFSLQDACALVAARGRLMGRLPSGGAMIAIEASEEEVMKTLIGVEDRVSVAGVNGPSSIVLSGDEQVVLELAGEWERQGRKTKRLRVSHAFHSPRMDGMLEEFGCVLAGLSFGEPTIPVVSNLSGEAIDAEVLCTPEYWVRHARETVRFADQVNWLVRQGVGRFLELGPDGVLTGMVHECLAEAAGEDKGSDPLSANGAARESENGEGKGAGRTAPLAVSLLRRERLEAHSLMSALAKSWVRGVEVEWSAVFADCGAERVDLPTYAFQRERYWLAAGQGHAGDPASFGQTETGHPMLGAVVALPDERGSLFTGRVSTQTFGWLADHTVMGATLMPASAFVELALHVGGQLGCELLEDLTLQTPLRLEDEGAVQIQAVVAEPDRSGRRAFSVYSRPEPAGGEGSFEDPLTCHASGTLAPGKALARMTPYGGEQWPPAKALALEVDGLYDRLLERELAYGPSFQGLQRAWRLGEHVFAEVSLSDLDAEQADRFGIHPALLDSALHTLAFAGSDTDVTALPVSLTGVRLCAQGARTLRVQLSENDRTGVSLLAFDESGALVVEIDSLAMRPATPAQIAGSGDDSLFALQWSPRGASGVASPAVVGWAAIEQPGSGVQASTTYGSTLPVYSDVEALVAAVADGTPLPDLVLAACPASLAGEDGSPTGREAMLADAHESARWALELIREWLTQECLASTRLVLLTQEALAVEDGDRLAGLAHAPVWGLGRVVQTEHPERLVLLDLQNGPLPWDLLAGALAADEPQLAIRSDRVLVPRLARMPLPERDAMPPDLDRTILITGGTGGIGAQLARRLVERHGARALTLVSRSGLQADGAEDLLSELSGLGAQVTIAACDVADRAQVESLLQAIPSDRPLGAVIHAAGVLDDGIVAELTPARLADVLRPKIDGALHLHELTAELDLSAFVLFSSAAGILGAAGQASYAAANAFLDSLAARRRGDSLPATAMAWGLWDDSAGMSARIDETNRARVLRGGMRAMPVELSLDLFEASLASESALVLPMGLDMGVLRSRARSGTLSPLFGSIVRTPSARSHEVRRESLASRLQTAGDSKRERLALDVTLAHTAAILGYSSQDAIESGQTFKDLGFDSLAAVELRNRLSEEIGSPLPATLIFDNPTPRAVARRLLAQLEVSDGVGGVGAAISTEGEITELERRLSVIASEDAGRATVIARMQALLAELTAGAQASAEDEQLRSATAQEMFELIDRDLAPLERDGDPHALG